MNRNPVIAGLTLDGTPLAPGGGAVHAGARVTFGLSWPAEAREPRVGDRHDPDVRVDGAERVVRRLRLRRAGERVEERGLPDVGETDDADAEGHDAPE